MNLLGGFHVNQLNIRFVAFVIVHHDSFPPPKTVIDLINWMDEECRTFLALLVLMRAE
jgi:hypothetical protein